MVLDKTLKDKILNLCDGVEAVVYNNDWPTSDGRMDENGDCHILRLVSDIRTLVKRLA